MAAGTDISLGNELKSLTATGAATVLWCGRRERTAGTLNTGMNQAASLTPCGDSFFL